METKNKWTEFCDVINRYLADVRKEFGSEEMIFVDNASSIVVDNRSEDDLASIKSNILEIVECKDEEKKELESKIEELLTCIRERDTKIDQLKNDADENKKQLGDWYKKAKHDCEELCTKLEEYTSDKLGVFSLFADIMETMIDKDGFYMEKARTTIKGKIHSEKRSSVFRVVADAMLFLIALGVMAVLFVMIGTEKGLCVNGTTVWGRWIAVGFILAFLVGAVFLIIRICSLIKKSKNKVQHLQSLLDKLKIHKMTKHEIDRELESIQEMAWK